MLFKAYCMIVVSDAPSSKPSPLLHFTLDPLRHKLDARTRANKDKCTRFIQYMICPILLLCW